MALNMSPRNLAFIISVDLQGTYLLYPPVRSPPAYPCPLAELTVMVTMTLTSTEV